MKGLILVQPIKGDYVQGTRLRLGGLPIQPDGQWDAFVPPDELQDKGLETMACASFGTKHAVEILERQEFGDVTEYSGRFLAESSGTTQYGNDPQTVAESLRKRGIVSETDWPYPDGMTWGQFYQTPPDNIQALAKQFNYRYDFGHQFCQTDQQSMMTALMYSPLGADVFAWNTPDSDGIYHRNGQPSEHWIVIYGYAANQYWKCFDTYNNTHKKLAWDFGFTLVKQYTLHKQVINETAWQAFTRWFRIALGLNGTVYGGIARSSEWPRVRATHLKANPGCAVCGGTKDVEVHHKQPYHLHPELELDPTNLITLCNHLDHHLTFGHLGNFKSFNADIEVDARIWSDKIKTRP